MSNVTNLRLRVLPRFPVSLTGTNGITVDREGGGLIVKPDFGQLAESTNIPNTDETLFIAWNRETDEYNIMPYGALFANIGAAYGYPTRALAEAASITPGTHAIEVYGDVTVGDGLGGLYVDTDNGSDHTFVSGDGRTWYFAADVSEERLTEPLADKINSAVQTTLATSPVLVQKFLMEPFFGFNNEDPVNPPVNTEIYSGAGYTAQGLCYAKLSTGEEYLFVAQRPVADGYLDTERHRIVQFPFRRDGSVAPHIAFSQELNIGHSGGLSVVVNPDDSITFYSWQVTDDAHEGDDSGKGFSKIEWKGAATSQADVTSYQVFGYNGTNEPRSAYRHVDCGVDHTGSEIAFIGYKRGSGSDEFIDQTVFIFDLQELLNAPNDATRLTIVPKEQWVHPVPFVDRGMYKQGIAIRNGIVAVISGFTNPMVPETISFYDRSGNLIRREQPTNNRAIYGLENLLNNPTLGTPMQFEPEGVCFIDDSEIIFLMMDQWRLNASIVNFSSPTGVSKAYSRITSGASTAPPSQVDAWCETSKPANRGTWSAAPDPLYTYGDVISRRSKMIHSLKVPTGESGELPQSAGMYTRWARMSPLISYENTPNATFKAEGSYQIFGYCYPMNEYIPAVEFLHSRTSNSTWRIHDFWNQTGPNFQLTYRWNGGREFGAIQFATGTGGIFFYGATDSANPGEVIVRNFGGGGLRVRTGSTGALTPFNSGANAGDDTLPFGNFRGQNVRLVPGISTTVTPTVNGEFTLETTSNSQVTLKLRGSDGTTRTKPLPLLDIAGAMKYQAARMAAGLTVNLACYGDSFFDGEQTTGWTANPTDGSGNAVGNTDHESTAPNAWPALLKAILRSMHNNNNINVWNAGYSAKAIVTDWAINNIDAAITNNPAYGIADIYFIGFGTNDAAVAGSQISTFGPKLRLLLEKVIRLGGAPVCITCPPFPRNTGGRDNQETTNQIDQVRRAVCGEMGVPVIEIGTVLSDWANNNADDHRWIEQQTDLLHWQNAGHTVWAGYLATQFYPNTIKVPKNERVIVSQFGAELRAASTSAAVTMYTASNGRFAGNWKYDRATVGASGTRMIDAWVWCENPNSSVVYRGIDGEAGSFASGLTNGNYFELWDGVEGIRTKRPPTMGFVQGTGGYRRSDVPAHLGNLKWGLNRISYRLGSTLSSGSGDGFVGWLDFPMIRQGLPRNPLQESGPTILRATAGSGNVATFLPEAPRGTNIWGFEGTDAVELYVEAKLPIGTGLIYGWTPGFGDAGNVAGDRTFSFVYRNASTGITLYTGRTVNGVVSFIGGGHGTGTVAAGDDIKLRINIDRAADNQITTVYEGWVTTTASITATTAYNTVVAPVFGGVFGGLFANLTAVTGTVTAEIRSATISM